MAKKSQVYRDRKRERLIAKHAITRRRLRVQLHDRSLTSDEKHEIQQQFAKLPRNSCPTRLTRRCRLTGRAHAVYRKFGLSRIKLRELALHGELPGMKKSSW